MLENGRWLRRHRHCSLRKRMQWRWYIPTKPHTALFSSLPESALWKSWPQIRPQHDLWQSTPLASQSGAGPTLQDLSYIPSGPHDSVFDHLPIMLSRRGNGFGHWSQHRATTDRTHRTFAAFENSRCCYHDSIFGEDLGGHFYSSWSCRIICKSTESANDILSISWGIFDFAMSPLCRLRKPRMTVDAASWTYLRALA